MASRGLVVEWLIHYRPRNPESVYLPIDRAYLYQDFRQRQRHRERLIYLLANTLEIRLFMFAIR